MHLISGTFQLICNKRTQLQDGTKTEDNYDSGRNENTGTENFDPVKPGVWWLWERWIKGGAYETRKSTEGFGERKCSWLGYPEFYVGMTVAFKGDRKEYLPNRQDL